jgi:hypothetical protein
VRARAACVYAAARRVLMISCMRTRAYMRASVCAHAPNPMPWFHASILNAPAHRVNPSQSPPTHGSPSPSCAGSDPSPPTARIHVGGGPAPTCILAAFRPRLPRPRAAPAPCTSAVHQAEIQIQIQIQNIHVTQVTGADGLPYTQLLLRSRVLCLTHTRPSLSPPKPRGTTPPSLRRRVPAMDRSYPPHASHRQTL